MQIMTDSGAYSDVVFGLFRLLGYRFRPRPADIGGRRFWRICRLIPKLSTCTARSAARAQRVQVSASYRLSFCHPPGSRIRKRIVETCAVQSCRDVSLSA
jgi:hypothetical protein